MTQSWSEPIGLHELGHGAVRRRLIAGEEARRAVAKALDLDALNALEADIEVTPWLDGVEIRGRWRAAVAQTCGVTLEPILTEPEGEFSVRALPAGSPNAPEEPGGETTVDLEADDPPDVIEDGKVDLAAYVVEHLALEIDPFPRKSDAVFTPPDEPVELSPFAVLRDFKPRRDDA
jgi:hypothetical protein